MKKVTLIIFVMISCMMLACSSGPPKSFFTPIEKNDLAAVKKLISKGHDVNAKNELGYTALMDAVGHNALEIAKVLIEAGAAVNPLDVCSKIFE